MFNHQLAQLQLNVVSQLCRLTVNVEDSAGSPAGQSELSLTVSYDVQLDSVTVAFSEGEIQGSINETLPYPQAMATQSATLDPSQTLKVTPCIASLFLSTLKTKPLSTEKLHTLYTVFECLHGTKRHEAGLTVCSMYGMCRSA